MTKTIEELKQRVEEVADFLGNYNRWRRVDDTIPMPDPKELGEVIDQAIRTLLLHRVVLHWQSEKEQAND